MNKFVQSFNFRILIGTVLQCKIQSLRLLMFFLFCGICSAQAKTDKEKTTDKPLIFVTGNAMIYSKDDDFNKQILNDKKIQENSKVEFGKNKALKISSKTSQKKLNEEKHLQEKSDSIAIETKKKKGEDKSIKSRKKSTS
jgi:hypothetical protein